MFLIPNVDLIFFLSLAFVAVVVIVWVVVAIIVTKKKSKEPSNNIIYPSEEDIAKIDENLNDNKEENIAEESTIEKDNIEKETPMVLEDNNNVEDVEAPILEENDSITENTDIIDSNNETVQEAPEESNEEAIADKNEYVESNETIENQENNDALLDESEEKIIEEAPTKEETSIEEDNTDTILDAEEEQEVVEEATPIIENSETEELKVDNNTEKKSPETTEEAKEDLNQEIKTENVIKVSPKKKGRTYNGKYEIFQVADGYAYQLKASNGEILVASETYSSRDSVIKAIKAVEKNLETGEVRIFADKRGKYKFKLIAKNHKTLAISASYSVEKSAVRASESFKKYAKIADIVDVEVDDNEFKMATPIVIESTEDKDSGKFVIEKFDGEYSWSLKASNGEILCQAEGYTSKNGCMYSIETFKKNIVEGQFKCIKDKNGHYCYKLYTANNRVCAIGESYTSKQNAESAANSVVAYYKNAVIEEVK